MFRRHRLSMMGLGILVIAAGLAGACQSKPEPAAVAKATSNTPASALRSQLNQLLSEHVYLAMDATGSALGGRADEFKASAAALDQNSVAIADVIGSAYGPEARQAFLDGWRLHIGFFVDYTNGVAGKDQAKKDKAVADLGQYATDLATLLNGANGMPKDAVISLVRSHAVGLTAVIDAQAAGNASTQYTQMREAAEHMHMLGDPIAEATVLKFPDKFVDSPKLTANH